MEDFTLELCSPDLLDQMKGSNVLKRALATLLASGALCAVAPGIAQAEWASPGCNKSIHCYGRSSWGMKGGGEEVLGLVSWIETQRMNVADWFLGTNVSNEQWAAQRGGAYWVEDGQESGFGGGGRDCCSLRWFTAYKNIAGYGANESPWNEPGWTFNHYLVKAQPGGTWCWEIGSASAGCVNGLYASSTEVQVGMEAGTEAEPENWGKAETAVDWLNQTWHHWNTASYVASRTGGAYTNHVCVGPWAGTYPGWDEFGTC